MIAQTTCGKLLWRLICLLIIIDDYLSPILQHRQEAGHWSLGYNSYQWQGLGVPWHRFLWADYLGKNTNVFQCSANWPLLPKIVSQSYNPCNHSSFVFNFAYGPNSDVLLSYQIRLGIKETEHPAVTDFSIRKLPEISSPADSVSFRSVLVGKLIGLGWRVLVRHLWSPHVVRQIP